MTMTADLVVLGAGPAGLAAAWFAARRGLSVVVLERAARVGGLAGSFEVAGVRVDHGSHRLHPATPATLLAELRGLLGGDLQTRRRNGRLRLADSWVRFPLHPHELAAALPGRTLAAAGRDALLAPFRRPEEDTFADVLRAGLGPTLYELMYAPYALKLWGLPGEQIDGEQARVRVTADTPWKAARRVLRAGRADGTGRLFHYPRRGFGQIAEALADAAVAAGARVSTGTDVVTVRARPDRVHVETAEGAVVEAGVALSTLPLTVLGRLAHPAPPARVVEEAAGLRFRGMTLVYLVHEGGRWSPYDAHYLPAGGTPVTRISEPANYRDSTDDPPDRSVLCAEIPCAIGDSVWASSDEDLASLVEEGLARVGLPAVRRAEVVVRRLPHVYPIYDRSYRRRLDALIGWADRLAHVVTLGRLGLFAHDNTHHALVMARDTVDAVGPGGRLDVTALHHARERWAAHVVED